MLSMQNRDHLFILNSLNEANKVTTTNNVRIVSFRDDRDSEQVLDLVDLCRESDALMDQEALQKMVTSMLDQRFENLILDQDKSVDADNSEEPFPFADFDPPSELGFTK